MAQYKKTKSNNASDLFTGSLFSADALEKSLPSQREVMSHLLWSYSRRNLLEQCPRQYYFRHYGSLRSSQESEAFRAQLQKLKLLKNRHFAAGQHLHALIAFYFKQAQKGHFLTVETLVTRARERFRRDVDYSQRDPQGASPPREPYPPALLQEFFYELSDAQALCDETENRMVQAMRNFASHPIFAAVKEAGEQPGSKIEIRCDFQFGCRVTGKIDLLYPIEDGFVLVDWKMGESSDEGDDSLQLAAYALWTCREFGCEPEQVQVFKAFLGSGDLVPFCADSDGLEAAQARILQDSARMAAVDNYGQKGVAEVFTACAQPGICRNCSYLQVCADGKECLDYEDEEFWSDNESE